MAQQVCGSRNGQRQSRLGKKLYRDRSAFELLELERRAMMSAVPIAVGTMHLIGAPHAPIVARPDESPDPMWKHSGGVESDSAMGLRKPMPRSHHLSLPKLHGGSAAGSGSASAPSLVISDDDPDVVYGTWTFDSTTSSEFISTASQAINMSLSLFGTQPGSPADTLQTAIEEGQADVGSVYDFALLDDLRQTVNSIEAVIDVRSSGGSNGWLMRDDSTGPMLFSDAEEIATLLPAESTSLSMRDGTGWSTNLDGSGLADGAPIDGIELDEVQSVVGTISSNGLWVENGSPSYTTTILTGRNYRGKTAMGDANFPALSTWPNASGSSYDDTSDPGYITYATGVDGSGNIISTYYYSTHGVTVSATLPSATNPYGGNSLTTLAVGPEPYDIGVSGWSWGGTPTIQTYSKTVILGAVEAIYPPSTIPVPTEADPYIEIDYTNQSTGVPHVVFNGSLEADYSTTYGQPFYNFTGTLTFTMQAPTRVFGLVPITDTFTP
jgi:hypothetical protein